MKLRSGPATSTIADLGVVEIVATMARANIKTSDGMVTTDELALRFDPFWTRSNHGYQQVTELFVDDDSAVDTLWENLTTAGYRGRTAPGHLNGPYAMMVEDPDRNVVLVTHEPSADAA
jgi:hypothetical protein